MCCGEIGPLKVTVCARFAENVVRVSRPVAWVVLTARHQSRSPISVSRVKSLLTIVPRPFPSNTFPIIAPLSSLLSSIFLAGTRIALPQNKWRTPPPHQAGIFSQQTFIEHGSCILCPSLVLIRLTPHQPSRLFLNQELSRLVVVVR